VEESIIAQVSDADIISNKYLFPSGGTNLVDDKPTEEANIADSGYSSLISSYQCTLPDGETAINPTVSDLRGCGIKDYDIDPTQATAPTYDREFIQEADPSKASILEVGNDSDNHLETSSSRSPSYDVTCKSANSDLVKFALKARFKTNCRDCTSRLQRRHYMLPCEFMKLNTSP